MHYEVYAWDLSVRSAHLDTTHGFFNGTSVFLAVAGRTDRPCLVTIDKPEAEVRSESPWNKQYNGTDHGYTLVTMDGAQLVAEYRRTDLTSPTGATTAFERFVQPSGANNFTRQTLAPSASSGV